MSSPDGVSCVVSGRWGVWLFPCGFQAVASSGQTAAVGDGWHRGQTAPTGRQETKRAQVGSHGVRPSHGAFKSRETQPELQSFKFYINIFTGPSLSPWHHGSFASRCFSRRWKRRIANVSNHRRSLKFFCVEPILWFINGDALQQICFVDELVC